MTKRPSDADRNNPKSVCRIAIEGHFLDEVRTLVHGGSAGKFLTYTSAPVERHEVTEDEEGVTLKLPALTVAQMYFDGILSADPTKGVSLGIAGRKPVTFFLQWLRSVSGEHYGAPVLLRFGKQPAGQRQAASKPDAWVKDLVPLRLYPQGDWDPVEEFWSENGEPVGDWAKAIIERGRRPMYEMEQILPGIDRDDIDSHPILEANELKERGHRARAKKLLERLLVKDIRCLDAHAHLGSLFFDNDAHTALNHYQRGALIGELSLGEDFEGVLPWGMIDNRPFLRCLNGLGLCLWRMRRFEEAQTQFLRILWMDPLDHLGIRFLLPDVRARKAWSEDPR